jgi:hypothetical protein
LYLVFSIPSSVTMNCCFILPFSTEHSSESLVTLVLGIYFGTESCNFFVDVGTYSKFSPLLSSGTGARIFLILFFSTSGSFFPVSFSSFNFYLYFFVYKASGLTLFPTCGVCAILLCASATAFRSRFLLACGAS